MRAGAGQSLEAEGLPSQESTTIRSRWSRAPSPLPRAKSESGCPWQVGDRCEHREHGKGTVVFVDYASPTVRPHPRIHLPSAALSICCADLRQPELACRCAQGQSRKLYVGVDLDYPYGKHDGTVYGTKYFETDKNHGFMTSKWERAFALLACRSCGDRA